MAVLDTKPIANNSNYQDIPPEPLEMLKIFSARAGAESERTLAEDALKQSAYAADAGNRAKSEFLSRMSQELRKTRGQKNIEFVICNHLISGIENE